MTNRQPNITAIVPAYNEAARIGAVLDVLTAYSGFLEIIVIDDGSTDGTYQVMQQYPVQALRTATNSGKGAAMDQAIQHARGDILFFCDADVHGLTHEIITAIVTPVIEQRVAMSIAMRHHYSLKLFPPLARFIMLLGGERALTKTLWDTIPPYYKHQYRIEAALNFYATHYDHGLTYKIFLELMQPTKDKKMGFISGNLRRISFIVQIVLTALRLRLLFLLHLVQKNAEPDSKKPDRH